MDSGIERDLDVRLWLGRGWIENDNMNVLKVLEQGMEVVELATAACIVATELSLAVEDAEGVADGVAACVWGFSGDMSGDWSEERDTYSNEVRSCAVGEPAGKRGAPNELARQEMGEPMKWRVNEAGLKVPVDE